MNLWRNCCRQFPLSNCLIYYLMTFTEWFLGSCFVVSWHSKLCTSWRSCYLSNFTLLSCCLHTVSNLNNFLRRRAHRSFSWNHRIIRILFDPLSKLLRKFSRTNRRDNLIAADISADSDEFKNELLIKSLSTLKAAFRQETSLKLIAPNGHHKHRSIFIIRKMDDFANIHTKISWKNFWLSGFYIIVLIHWEIPEAHKMFKLLWKLQIYNVNLMFKN